MSEDEGPDSDSSGREFRSSVTSTRIRRRKEARVYYSSRTTAMSLQDPMPEYVDPELLKLIAQNAPFELDVFMRSFRPKSSRRAENGGILGGAVKEGERRPALPVEALLSSVRERKDHLSGRHKAGDDVRHSCPERIWRYCDEKDEDSICRGKAVKRKRPKGLDGYRLPATDRQFPSEVSLRMRDEKGGRELRGAGLGNSVAFGSSSDEGTNCLEDERLPLLKADAFEVSSAPAPHSGGKVCDVLNAKPWRHGMRKGSRSPVKTGKPPPASTCCKSKAEAAASRKTSEVRKYMETKMLERRKEQQQLKAEADAALVARKEQQRKLDLHRQATFQSQVSSGKGRDHETRPAWVSEYSSLYEPPRPWSSSSGEFGTYLPPPVTPPKVELIPLDLYATQFQYAQGQPSTPRMDGIQLQNARPTEKRRCKKVKGCNLEVHRQPKYRKSQITKEFAHTDLEHTKLANSPVKRKARWKAKTKPRGPKLSSEEFFQLQKLEQDEANLPRRSGDLEVYMRSLKRQFYSNCGSLCKVSRTQNLTSRVSPDKLTKSIRPAESSVKSVIKDHVFPLSKVKRLKSTERLIPCKTKDLREEELATLLNANRLPSDRESETNLKVITERMRIVRTSPTSPAASEQELITNLRKCVGHSLCSPQKKNTADEEDVCSKWFGASLECSEKHLIDEDFLRQESRAQMLDSSLKLFRSKELQMKQVLDIQKEGPDPEILRATTRKDPTMAVRWQRMQMLKNLAEQLVKRVDAACSKKRQIERSAVEQIKSPCRNIDTVPSELLAPAESGHEVDSLEPEPIVDDQPKLNNIPSSTHVEGSMFRESGLKFFHPCHPKQNNNGLQCRGLTEEEQAGCETPSVQLSRVDLKVKQSSSTSPRRRVSTSEANDHNRLAGGPVSSEICTMIDWNVSDKGTDVTCNNPSACSSLSPSSPSTGSSSPVILPTSSKYHLGRIKHRKLVSNEEKIRRLSKKLDWIIPAENDTHSIFNVYTQHLKDREKATSTFPHVVQNDLEKIEIDPWLTGRAAGENAPTIASIPLSQKVTMTEFPVRPELMSVQTVRSADSSHENTASPEFVGTGSGLQRKPNLSSSNFESLQNMGQGADKSAIRPPAELNISKTDAMELGGINPEVTILEIGDLKLCQSPTSFHLRLDRSKDNSEETEVEEQKLVDISLMPDAEQEKLARVLKFFPFIPKSFIVGKTYVGSKPETSGQRVSNFIPPMKVTYARRVHSRAMPDGGCTDERVVVELNQMSAEAPAAQMRGETRLDDPVLDASEAVPQGLAISRLEKGIGNARSGIQEKSATKLSTVNEDVRTAHVFSKVKGNVALQPILDSGPDHSMLVAFDGETGLLCTTMTCQKGALTAQTDYISKPDPQIDCRDSQEWELKHKRDQLEAELQKLDAEIMKTRARLQQRHSMIDSQVQSVSSSPLADQPVEGSLQLDNLSNVQKRSAKHLANKERHNVGFELGSDSQVEKIAATSHSNPTFRRDEEKTVTSSNSYSDSFVTDDPEIGQKIIPGTGTCDSLNEKTINNLCRKSFKDPKSHVNQQFEGALEDRTQDNQRYSTVKKEVEAESHFKTPSAQDFASEGSEMSTWRGPGRRFDMPPPQVDPEESASARHIILSKVKSTLPVIPDQIVGEAQLSAKDERNMLESRTAVCVRDGAIHDSVDTTTDNNSRRGPKTSLNSIPQKFDGKVVTREKSLGQTSFPQNRKILREERNSHELLECGARESPSSAVQCLGSQNTENNKNCPMSLARNGMLSAETTGFEISNGNRTPSSSTQQNGWHIKGKQQGNVAPCDVVQGGLPCPIGLERKEGRTYSTAVPGKLVLSSDWTTSGKCSGGVPGRELVKESQTNGEEMMVTKRAALPAGSQNGNTSVSTEASFGIVAAAEELPCPLHHPVGESGEHIIPLVPNRRHCTLQTSQCPMETPGQTFSQCNNIGTANKVLLDGKVSTCSHEEGKISDEAVATINAASLTPVKTIPCGSTTKEADWESLSLPSHMDFSTIKKKLRNNKLAGDDLRPFSNGWSKYPDESSKSPSISEEAGGDSSGVGTVVSESINEDVAQDSQIWHKIDAAAKSTRPPEMAGNQENGFLALPSRSKCMLTDRDGDSNCQYSDTQGLIIPPGSSARELSKFLPSLYFRQEMINANPSEEGESTISEDLENCESDIDEEVQVDDAVSSGCNFETTSSWNDSSSLLRNNGFITSTTPDLACCVGDVGSSNIKILHSESGLLSVTNGPISGTSQVCKSTCSIESIIDQDMTAVGFPEPCMASQMESTMLSRHPEKLKLSVLHAGDQHKSQPLANCTSAGDPADGDVIGSSQSFRTTVNEDDSNLLKITMVSDNYSWGSEVSHGSHVQSESISEELGSVVDSETSPLYRSGPHRERNIHCDDFVDFITREDSNDDDNRKKNCVGVVGKHYACNAMLSSSARPESADFMENAGADFQETARSGDDSKRSKKPVEFSMSCTVAQVRASENSISCDSGTHFSTVSTFGKLSCAKDYQVRETPREEKHYLFENTSGMKLKSAFNKGLITGTLSNATPGESISSPGEMVTLQTANTIFYREPSDPATVCNLDVAREEGSPILMQKAVDHRGMSLPSYYRRGLNQEFVGNNWAVDVLQKRGCNRENSLAEEQLDETEQLSDVTHNLSYNLAAADSFSDNGNGTNIIVGEEDNRSAVAVSTNDSFGHSRLRLHKVPNENKKGFGSMQLDCGGSQSDPSTFAAAKDILDSSCLVLLTGTTENQHLPFQSRIADVESERSFNSFYDDQEGPATPAHQIVPADRDLLSRPETESSYRYQNTSLRPDQIIALQTCQADKLSSTSPLLGNQKFVIDGDKYAAETEAHDNSYNRQVESDCADTNTEFEGHTKSQMISPVSSSNHVRQTHLPSQHGPIMAESPTNCGSSGKGFLSHTPESIISRDSPAKEASKLPLAEGVEGCSSDICSTYLLPLKSARENMVMEESRELSREIQHDLGSLGSKPISSSDVPDEEHTKSTTCLTALPEASGCFTTICSDAVPNVLDGIMQNIRIQLGARRAEKQVIVTDLLTSMIYEDMLSVELSGFHQEVERTRTAPETSGQMNQTAKVTKAFNPKVKSRSRKVSKFCQVLKHFLPIGWRSASVRHKTGLFLHVEGQRPHPLNPATKPVPGALKLNDQYPCYGQSELFLTTATQFLHLDSSDMHLYVQRCFELSNLILDPSPANWYDPKKPVGEHIFRALESQFWEASHMLEHRNWQIHVKLISDLINETILKQFAAKLLFPSLGMTSLPLQACGENLVQFVTDGIVEYERFASKHGFDIEKVIAKAFEDEHWEKCSEEATDLVGDLAQEILGDLIERFVYEMIRGWCYCINQCHVLAS